MVKAIHSKFIYLILTFVILVLISCTGRSDPTLVLSTTQQFPLTITPAHIPPTKEVKVTATPDGMHEDSSTDEEVVIEEKEIVADILSVKVSGSVNRYQISVEISSPDTGCEQYADWWEILSEDGELIYRRILLHSHVNEQPFTRSGGPVDIGEDTVVIIRAHMNPTGYEGSIMKGTVGSGFVITDMPADFAPGAELEPPLPTGCNF